MTTHSLEARQRAARNYITCSLCAQPPSKPCKDAGEVVAPHAERLAEADVWFAGYDFAVREGGLKTQLTNALHDLDVAVDQVGTLTDDVRDAMRRANIAEDNAANLAEQLKTARIGAALVPGLQQQVADLLAKIAKLENPDPDPEPPTQRMFFGACPDKTGSSNKGLADAKRVTDKWGKGAAVRQYFGGIGDVAPRDPNAGIVHASWKEFNKANLTAAKVKAAVANLLPSDVVEVGHESDNDGLTGTTQAARVDIKNTFYDVVKQVRPDLLVANTVTGWALDPKSSTDMSVWVGAVKADVLGADCDGIRPTKLPYTNYEDETRTAVALIAKYAAMGYRWFSLPEFGCPRIPAADPDGDLRAAYHDHYARLWTETGKCLYVCLYEYDSSPNYSLTTHAEISGWMSWV